MTEVWVSVVDERKELPMTSGGASLMTPLGVVEGEVLEYLDRHEIVTLQQLHQEVGRPAYLVMMAAGALVRAGLVRGVRHDLAVIAKPRRPLSTVRSPRPVEAAMEMKSKHALQGEHDG